jgi:hypothetical protein
MVRAINSPAVTWMGRVSTRGGEDSPAERAAGLATNSKPIGPVPSGSGSELEMIASSRVGLLRGLVASSGEESTRR